MNEREFLLKMQEAWAEAAEVESWKQKNAAETKLENQKNASAEDLDKKLQMPGYKRFIAKHLGEAMDVAAHGGCLYDLDEIVQLEHLLGFNVTYDMQQYLSGIYDTSLGEVSQDERKKTELMEHLVHYYRDGYAAAAAEMKMAAGGMKKEYRYAVVFNDTGFAEGEAVYPFESEKEADQWIKNIWAREKQCMKEAQPDDGLIVIGHGCFWKSGYAQILYTDPFEEKPGYYKRYWRTVKISS